MGHTSDNRQPKLLGQTSEALNILFVVGTKTKNHLRHKNIHYYIIHTFSTLSYPLSGRSIGFLLWPSFPWYVSCAAHFYFYLRCFAVNSFVIWNETDLHSRCWRHQPNHSTDILEFSTIQMLVFISNFHQNIHWLWTTMAICWEKIRWK